MKESILEYTNFEEYNVKNVLLIRNYNSIMLSKIRNYLNSLSEDYFVYLKVELGSTIEKTCLDYYNSSDYYDLVMFLNSREMLYDMPYNYDVILDAVEKDLETYRAKVYKDPSIKLSEKAYNELYQKLLDKYDYLNNIFMYYKVIKLGYVLDVIREIKDIIKDEQEYEELQDLES